MSEQTFPQQATGAAEPVERPRNAVPGMVVALLVLVPVAFVSGWRARRRLDRMLLGL